jgi:hypothetical protein
MTAHNCINVKTMQMLYHIRIVHQCDNRLIKSNTIKRSFRLKITRPQIAQSYEPQPLTIDFQNARFISQNADTAIFHPVDHSPQGTVSARPEQTADSIIMVAQTRINPKPASNTTNQLCNLFPESTVMVVCNVVTRQHNDISVQKIDPLNASPQILAGHRPAVVKVADVNYPLSIKRTGQVRQLKADLNYFDPLSPCALNTNSP